MTTKAEKVRSRIVKLLRLARGAGTVQEASTAAAQAARLMTQHAIHVDLDDEGDEIPEDIISTDDAVTLLMMGERIDHWRCALASQVALLCGCYSWLGHREGGRAVLAIGRPSDLATAQTLIPALLDTVETVSRQQGGRKWRSFAKGMWQAMFLRMLFAQNVVMAGIRKNLEHAIVPQTRFEQAEARAESELSGRMQDLQRTQPDERAYLRGVGRGACTQIPGEHAAVAEGRLPLPPSG